MSLERAFSISAPLVSDIFIIINVQEVDLLMKVNTTELRTHLSDYLTMANKEEIIITNKGIEIAEADTIIV